MSSFSKSCVNDCLKSGSCKLSGVIPAQLGKVEAINKYPSSLQPPPVSYANKKNQEAKEQLIVCSFKISQALSEEIASKAKSVGLTKSKFIRHSVNLALGKFDKDQLNFGKRIYIFDEKLLSAFSSASSNINQIAKALNGINKGTFTNNASGFFELLFKIEQTISSLLNELVQNQKQGGAK